MRTLSLLRHAKSSWEAADLPDVARPLAARGRKAAPLIGRYMRRSGLEPDLVLCSPAARTRETATLALAELKAAPDPTIDRALYEADSDALLARLAEIPDNVAHALLIGHNPGLQHLALALAAELPDDAAWLAEKLPTGGLVVLALDIAGWRDIGPGKARIIDAMRPRDLEG